MHSVLQLLFLLLGLCNTWANPHCPKKCFCDKHLTSVNCGGKNLKEIPPDIPPTVEKLYLNNNMISQIPPYAFANYTSLSLLDLRQNLLIKIGEHYFSNCLKLQTLNLMANHIKYVHPEAFRGSPQVKYFSLQSNGLKIVPSLPYLINLETLVLQGNQITNATFPESFSRNIRLTDIVMSSNSIAALNNRTFLPLRYAVVKKVEIAHNHIGSVENGTFSPLWHLTSLKIGYNPLGSAQLPNVIKGLSPSSFASLDIRNLSFAGKLPSETFSLLRNTNITSLLMSYNKINVIPSGAFEDLPKLVQLELSSCEIYSISESAFQNLTGLQRLFLNDNKLTKVPHGLPSSLRQLSLTKNSIAVLADEDLINLKKLEELHLVENNINELGKNSFLGVNKLTHLYLSHNIISFLPGNLFYPLSSLVSLVLDNNNLNAIQIHEGYFASLTSLVYLNLNDNSLSNMQLDLFGPLKSLLYLHLTNNNLDSLIANDSSGMLFKGLSKLKELHLSNNGIVSLPEPLLAEQKLLGLLNVSRNRISHWDQNFFVSTQSLQTLDLSMNLVSLINETSLSNLRSLKSLNLSGNPFACNCDSRWFCNWTNTTDVELQSKSKFTCNLPSEWQGKLMSAFCAAHIDCTNYMPYYIAGGAAGGFLLSLLVFGVVYRYRWYVKHKFYKLGRRLRRTNRTRRDYMHLPGEDNQYDIYLSYADEDRSWVAENIVKHFDNGESFGVQNEGTYRVCFRERDFRPGRTTIGSMHECIPASRHVVIIGTQNYATCSRCEFELDMVIDLQAQKEIDDYQLVVVGKLPLKVPKAMARMLQRHNYIEWVDVETAERTFIERLTDQIGTNSIGDTAEA